MNDNPIASRIGDNWTCPYCGHAQVISKERCTHLLHPLNVAGWSEGKAGYFVQAIVCANSQCKKLSVNFGIVELVEIFHAGALTSPRSLPNGGFSRPRPPNRSLTTSRKGYVTTMRKHALFVI